MMLLAPAYLYAALAVAAGVVALHFIVTRQPRAVVLPTARFVPEAPVTASARRIELSDLLLLALRVLMVLAIGTALARPIATPARERVVRVIAADVSGSVARGDEVRDSVRALLRRGDALVAFDTVARVVAAPDSLTVSTTSGTTGSFSAALIAAVRAGSSVRAGADSVELVMVSAFDPREFDRATHALRGVWPGRARLVRVVPAPDSVRATARVMWQRGAERPPSSVARARTDTIGAVMAGGVVAVAPFERRWMYPPDSLRGARVVARWVDGDPAAIERASLDGCIRSVAIRIDSTGDIALRPGVSRMRATLGADCGGARDTHAAADDSTMTSMLRGGGRLARASEFPPLDDASSPLARWLLGVALVLALAELGVRMVKPREGVR